MVEKNTIITYHIMQCFPLMFRMVTYLQTKDLLANLSIYKQKKGRFCNPFSGERGIRTPGTSQYVGFQDRCNRPLCHLS